MDNKPSLSQYFGETEIPPASQFFDEIGTSPSDMIQSVYLGESEGKIFGLFTVVHVYINMFYVCHSEPKIN